MGRWGFKTVGEAAREVLPQQKGGVEKVLVMWKYACVAGGGGGGTKRLWVVLTSELKVLATLEGGTNVSTL